MTVDELSQTPCRTRLLCVIYESTYFRHRTRHRVARGGTHLRIERSVRISRTTLYRKRFTA
ncbi:MAG: hypothetical protein WCR46_02775 [Deltaproteobacteria bacterium]